MDETGGRMGKPELQSPWDFEASTITGWTRRHWEEAFLVLMRPLFSSASRGGARQLIPGPRSKHGSVADELEGFSRSMILAGPWLHGSDTGVVTSRGVKLDIGEYLRRGVLAGTDPQHPEYWGAVEDYSQHLAELAALAWGLFLSRRLIWDQLEPPARRQIADYLFACTRAQYRQNNWLLFNVVTNAVLKRLDMPHSQSQIESNLAACERMYVGEGWYRDGDHNRLDYYNAWGFTYYGLIWTILDGDSNPELAQRHRERARRFVHDFRYFFGGDGGLPCFGRSMSYRFGYLAPVVLGQHLGCLDVSAGQVRTMAGAAMRFFFAHDILTEQGHLSLGFLRPCADMVEDYATGGSPYWATKAFNILLIPPEDPFWRVEEKPLPIHESSYAHPLRKAGLLLVGEQRTGHVQLVNQKSHHHRHEYGDRYTKFAYSSVFSREARTIHGNVNCDNALQFSKDGVRFAQRWQIQALYCEPGFAASRYPMTKVDRAGSVHTSIVVKDDFMVNLHWVETTKSLRFREGGYPLGFDEGLPRLVSTAGGEVAYKDGKLTFIRNLAGYTRQRPAHRFADDLRGSNIRYRDSVVPVLEHENGECRRFWLASLVCARIGQDQPDSLMALVADLTLIEQTAWLTFYDGERAFVQAGEIEQREVVLNGRSFSGPIVCARVSASGDQWSVLRADGSVEGPGLVP
jgi:hypothetical protein